MAVVVLAGAVLAAEGLVGVVFTAVADSAGASAGEGLVAWAEEDLVIAGWAVVDLVAGLAVAAWVTAALVEEGN
jgi:hypothetical protein